MGAYLNALREEGSRTDLIAALERALAQRDSLTPFNLLSPAEAERLALLAEELGEAQQAIGKVLRHGYQSRHPNGGATNRERLCLELGDVLAAIWLLTHADDLDHKVIDTGKRAKLVTVAKYLHHQGNAP